MFIVIALMFACVNSVFAADPHSAVVVVPVADVWSRPINPGEKPSDDLRETQVLFGEKVLIHESSGTWVKIEAVEQPEYTHNNRWEGYPGWMSVDALGKKPFVRCPVTSEKPLLDGASDNIGTPYIWGGLSYKKGLDCSGLVHLVYRLEKIKIPRDSHEQWMKAKTIKRAELKPADLIFSAKADNPKKVTHVALYAGDGQIIEAPQTGMVVRKVSFQEKYGRPLDKVESGEKVGDRVIYFGSFLQK